MHFYEAISGTNSKCTSNLSGGSRESGPPAQTEEK